MTDVVQDETNAGPTSRQRPPAGVVVIAVLCMLEAGVMAVAALFLLAAPGERPAYGFPGDSRRALVDILIVLLLPAALFGAAGFNLLRRRNWSRRVTIALLLLQAFGQVRSLFESRGVTAAMTTVLLVLSVAGAVYLSRANVKRLFTSSRLQQG
jgi:hypothetical protein